MAAGKFFLLKHNHKQLQWIQKMQQKLETQEYSHIRRIQINELKYYQKDLQNQCDELKRCPPLSQKRFEPICKSKYHFLDKLD